MTETEYLLVSLMEECAEMQQAIAKMLRFGPQDRYPTPEAPTTLEKLQGETIDAAAVIELLESRGLKIIRTDDGVELAIQAKKDKVAKYMKYAHVRGTIGDFDQDVVHRLRIAAADFVHNIKTHNVAGAGELHVQTDNSFQELEKAVAIACLPNLETTPGEPTPATGSITSDPGGPG